MGSLRDLLNKQKLETENAARSALSNGQAVKSENTPPAQAAETLPEKTNGAAGGIRDIGSSSGQENPAVLSEGLVGEKPPAGMSGLALIRWKKEHAGVSNNNKTQSTASSVLQSLPAKVEASIPKIPAQESKQFSDSETNQSQKKNDGVIDTTELRRNLEYLANNIEQKELVGQIVRTIATQLKQSPELTPYMKDADVDLVVRGLRSSYAIVARKKSADREAKATKTKSSDDLARMFKDAGLDDLNKLKF